MLKNQFTPEYPQKSHYNTLGSADQDFISSGRRFSSREKSIDAQNTNMEKLVAVFGKR